MLRACFTRVRHAAAKWTRPLMSSTTVYRLEKADDDPIEPELIEPSIPSYVQNPEESVQTMRNRLLWQSRKRGILETCLLLGSFAEKNLKSMSEQQLKDYDLLINTPSNEWDLYYWAAGKKPTPPEFDNEVMSLFRDHVLNSRRRLAEAEQQAFQRKLVDEP